MTASFAIDLKTAIGPILDLLARERTITLGLPEPDADTGELDALLTALHGEACRRGMAVLIEERAGSRLCLSLRDP
jgi:hypothetical protein